MTIIALEKSPLEIPMETQVRGKVIERANWRDLEDCKIVGGIITKVFTFSLRLQLG